MAGAAGVNPLAASNIPSFPQSGPLIRTSRFSGPPSERPDWRDPEEQWDVRPAPSTPQTVGTRGTISTADAVAQSNANMTSYQREAYERLSMTPSSADVVRSVSQPAPTGIAGGTMGGLPEVERQFPSQIDREPMAPVTAGIGGLTQRRGVRTAYGMVYPSAGQDAAAQQLARRRPMEGRLANVREQSVVRPQMVASAISEIEAGRGAKSLEGLTQAEKIAAMRQRGSQLAKTARLETEEYFNVAKARRDEKFRQKEEKRIFAEAARERASTARRAERKRIREERKNKNFVEEEA